MHLNLNPHTIVLLVGPTCSGKSTLAEKIRQACDKHVKECCEVLSSDTIRGYLLSSTGYPHHHPVMLSVSEQAFDLLFANLKALTSFPVKRPFIVVDTTGMDDNFRDQIRAQAKEAHYECVAVVLDYKNKQEYYPEGADTKTTKIIGKSINRLRREVLPVLKSKDYAQYIRVKSRGEMERVTVDVDWVNLPVRPYSCTVPVAVIGDSHECTAQLKGLREKILSQYSNCQIIHVGDYLDKGGDTAGIISYMEECVVKGGDLLVMGNHESFVAKRLLGLIEPASEEVERNYFTSLAALTADVELQKRFLDLHEHAVPSVVATAPNGREIIVTHAPCELKYIGKTSPRALRAMRNMDLPSKTIPVAEQCPWVHSQANSTHPWLVSGHVTHDGSQGVLYKNSVFLDTGCVNGHYLTAAVFVEDRVDLIGVPGLKEGPHVKPLPETFVRPEKKESAQSYVELTKQDHYFLRNFQKDGVKYISGTMAPAASKAGELEPLGAAFDYYQKHEVSHVILQPKYMGSRAQVYLTKGDPEKDFAVSRNGWKINHLDLSHVFSSLRTRLDNALGNWGSIILDGEITPWTAMGEGLIDKDFRAYEKLAEHELGILSGSEELSKLSHLSSLRLDERNKGLSTFKEMLELYGRQMKEGELPKFNVFNVLQIEGAVTPFNQDFLEDLGLNPDMKTLEVALSNPESVTKAQEFFNHLTTVEGMEGVVVRPIKPVYSPSCDFVEFMKVRNEKYLHLIYGSDYLLNYDRFCQEKHIEGKLRASARESRIGWEMLAAKDESELKSLAIDMIGTLRTHEVIDPRL